MEDPIRICVVKVGSPTDSLISALAEIDREVKKIEFSKVVDIAETFGLSDKLIDITEGRAEVKACYHRKPASAADELVVVVG